MTMQQPLTRFSGDPDNPIQPATFLQEFEVHMTGLMTPQADLASHIKPYLECDSRACVMPRPLAIAPFSPFFMPDPPPYLPKTYQLPSSDSSTQVTPKTSPDTRKKPSYTYPH
ncbi:hypothetical protein C8R41DRAFT_915879 [Lentinula lateritia]|uniref:Uncharacterized protein n=1 Tax=Lentinula lateritia TaxID=40482 RepID=A0ABQ8VQX3_9AGAR|nr:hypothetical protein C8R41DRAFT_915879 [Lentinula lateritia]